MIQYLCRKHQEIGGIKAFSVLRYSDSRLLPQAAITHRATVRVQAASGSNPDTPTRKETPFVYRTKGVSIQLNLSF